MSKRHVALVFRVQDQLHLPHHQGPVHPDLQCGGRRERERGRRRRRGRWHQGNESVVGRSARAAALTAQRFSDGPPSAALAHSYTELRPEVKCVGSTGDTISFPDLSPVVVLEVTFRFKSGRNVTKMIDLQKIGKLCEATFHHVPKPPGQGDGKRGFPRFDRRPPEMPRPPPGCCDPSVICRSPCSQTQKSSRAERHLPPGALHRRRPRGHALPRWRLPEGGEPAFPAADLELHPQHGSGAPVPPPPPPPPHDASFATCRPGFLVLTCCCCCSLLFFCAQIQNISSKATLRIDEAHLRKNTKYHVKVRAISQVFGQRTWSEWSQPYNFSTPAGERESDRRRGKTDTVVTAAFLLFQQKTECGSPGCGRRTR